MEKLIKIIINQSINAPSGDNSQPWKFKIKGDSVVIFKKGEGNNNYLDFMSRGTFLAHGALLANIEVVASANKCRTEIFLCPDKTNLDIVSEVKFILDETVIKDPLYDYLDKRSTNRKPFKNQPISANDKKFIVSELFSDVMDIEMIDDNEKKCKVFSSTTKMEEIALGNKYIHKLFFDSIVWSKKEESLKKIGLYIKTMELPKPIEIFFRLLKYWPVAKLLSKIGFPKKVSENNARSYQTSSAVAIFKLKGSPKSESFISVGMAVERFWLKATMLGIAVQPLAGLIYVYQRLFETNNSDGILTNEDVDLVERSYSNIKDTLERKDGTISMILRLGYADEPSARSSKKEPEFINI